MHPDSNEIATTVIDAVNSLNNSTELTSHDTVLDPTDDSLLLSGQLYSPHFDQGVIFGGESKPLLC